MDERESEARPRRAAAAVGAEEALVDAGDIPGRDANAGVGDRHLHGAGVSGKGKRDGTANGREFQRIVEEIARELLDLVAMPDEGQGAGRNFRLQRDALHLGDGGEQFARLADDFRQVDFLGRHAVAAGVVAGYLDVGVDGAEKGVAGLHDVRGRG